MTKAKATAAAAEPDQPPVVVPVPVSPDAWLRIPIPVWNAIIAAIVTVAITWMQLQTKNAVQEVKAVAEDAAVQTESVRKELKQSDEVRDGDIEKLKEVLDDTHAVTSAVKMELNGVTLAHLVTNAALAKRVAQLSGDPEDALLATAAAEAVKTHEEATAKATKAAAETAENVRDDRERENIRDDRRERLEAVTPPPDDSTEKNL